MPIYPYLGRLTNYNMLYQTILIKLFTIILFDHSMEKFTFSNRRHISWGSVRFVHMEWNSKKSDENDSSLHGSHMINLAIVYVHLYNFFLISLHLSNTNLNMCTYMYTAAGALVYNWLWKNRRTKCSQFSAYTLLFRI